MLTIAGGIILAVVILVIAISIPAVISQAFNEFSDAAAAARQRWLEIRAKKGSAKAQYELAQILGLHEKEESKRLYRMAAEQGYAEAEYMMGQHSSGDEAEKWLKKAAKKGHVLAMYNLGERYKPADSIPEKLFGTRRPNEDVVESYKWFSLAAAADEFWGARQRDELANTMTPDQIAVAQRLAREWKASFHRNAKEQPA